MSFWLVKTEPETFSIQDLERAKKTQWDSVRNYQARNYLQAMKLKDLVLIYHSNAEPPAVVGLAEVVKTAYADPTQFERGGDYFDPKATKEAPRWFAPDLAFRVRFETPIPIAALRAEPTLKNMALLARGSRLSVQPVTEKEFQCILAASGFACV